MWPFSDRLDLLYNVYHSNWIFYAHIYIGPGLTCFVRQKIAQWGLFWQTGAFVPSLSSKLDLLCSKVLFVWPNIGQGNFFWQTGHFVQCLSCTLDPLCWKVHIGTFCVTKYWSMWTFFLQIRPFVQCISSKVDVLCSNVLVGPSLYEKRWVNTDLFYDRLDILNNVHHPNWTCYVQWSLLDLLGSPKLVNVDLFCQIGLSVYIRHRLVGQ